MNNILGIIIGSVIAGVIGFATVIFNQCWNDRQNRKNIKRMLSVEIVNNQKELKKFTRDGLDNYFGNYFSLPEKTMLDRKVYSSLLDKISLLDIGTCEKLIKYFNLSYFLEEEYAKLIRRLGRNVTGCKRLVTLSPPDTTFFVDLNEAIKIGENLLSTLNIKEESI